MDPHRATQSPQHDIVHSDDPISNNLNLTFISIHDLSPDARILYSSESIVDVLGYTPDEIVNRSVWDFFPQEEVPYAKQFHKHGIEMDKAAMLAYCRVRDREGQWVGCECCFTIVYDVMVVCTSVYRSGLPSQKRAMEAPLIRRMFSSSPRDPRYHMLSHISQKFQQPAKVHAHEPRAALFLNRFTRTLTIMYATSGIEEILGIPSSSLQGKSFYYCIAENCLPDAIRCLEQAKGNDSIAYLRFWYRDPRSQYPSSAHQSAAEDSDDEMTTESSVDQDAVGGVQLSIESDQSTSSNAVRSESSMDLDGPSEEEPQSRTSSGDSLNPTDTHEGIFGQSRESNSSASSAPVSPDQQGQPIELEAVISCASDGLVVCLRRARPMGPLPAERPTQPRYANGLFAAPWADDPMVPPLDTRPQFNTPSSFAPALGPQAAQARRPTGGPDPNDFMDAIREQAIFAWALTGINGSLQRFGSGVPRGESVPTSGLPVWQSDKSYQSSGSSNGSVVDSGSSSTVKGQPKSPVDQMGMAVGNDHRSIFGDPGIKHGRKHSASSGSNNNITSNKRRYEHGSQSLPDGVPDDMQANSPDGIPNGGSDGLTDRFPNDRYRN